MRKAIEINFIYNMMKYTMNFKIKYTYILDII